MAIDINKEIARIRDQVTSKYQTQIDSIKEKIKNEIDMQVENLKKKYPQETSFDDAPDIGIGESFDLTEKKDHRGLEAIEDSFAEKYGVPVKKIRKIADGIKRSLDAADWEQDDNYYRYIVGTLKKILANLKEEAPAAITTTSVGNSSSYGGQANYAPKMGMVSRKLKKSFVDHYKD